MQDYIYIKQALPVNYTQFIVTINTENKATLTNHNQVTCDDKIVLVSGPFESTYFTISEFNSIRHTRPFYTINVKHQKPSPHMLHMSSMFIMMTFISVFFTDQR